MKRTIIQKAGTVFLSTTAGFCFLSAEAGIAQDAAGGNEIQHRLTEMYARDGRTLPGHSINSRGPSAAEFAQLPLEPPRPAIRPPAPEPPKFLEPILREAKPLPQIIPGSPRKTPSNSPAAKSPASAPVIVPRFAPLEPQTAPVITPGPSKNPSLLQHSAVPEAQLAPPLNAPAAPADVMDDTFEMPILSVPTLTENSWKPEIEIPTKESQAAEPKDRAQAKSFESRQEEAKPNSPQKPAAVEEVGLEGFCPVTLRDGRTEVKGSKQHETQWQGTVYRLATPQAKQRFEARPDFYAPAHGGLDVIKTAALGKKIPGSLEHAVWYRRQLYLFQDADTQKTFTANPEKYAGK